MNIAVDWPALLQRLVERDIDVRRVLRVSRVTIWRWRTRTAVPSGVHATSLVALDAGHTMLARIEDVLRFELRATVDDDADLEILVKRLSEQIEGVVTPM